MTKKRGEVSDEELEKALEELDVNIPNSMPLAELIDKVNKLEEEVQEHNQTVSNITDSLEIMRKAILKLNEAVKKICNALKMG